VAPTKFWRAGGAPGWASGRARREAHLGARGGRCWGGGMASEVGQLRGSAGLDNKRPWEVHWGLGDLGKWPAGGERERGGELTAAVAMAARCDGMARGGGTAGFYRWLGGPWVTAA
jgi:hypothetical protein